MRALLLAMGLVLLRAADLAQSADAPTAAPTTRKWAVNPHHAAYAKGDVAVQSNKGQNAEGTANKANLDSHMNVQGRGDFNAKKNDPNSVKATNPKGMTAMGDRSKKDQGLRTGDAGKYHGDLKNSKSGNDQNWNPSLSTGQKMDTVMHGNKDSFDAAGSKGHKYNVDPATQDKAAGSGVITKDGEKYNYKETKSGNSDVNVQMTNVGTGTNRKTYTCQGAKGAGISNCVDQNGLKYGEVVEQPDGTVIVKKTIAKGVDVPVGKATVKKGADGKSTASLNDGMFQGQAGNTKERDCMADYGKSGNSKVKMEKPLTCEYSSQSKNGRKEFQFPDCVKFGGKMTLPPGVDMNRVAIQFDVNILPAGKLKCVDMGSCNKDCYYCNLCNNTKKADFLGNDDLRQACAAKGGQTFNVIVTACPPPEAFNKAQCSGFTKSDLTYYKKKGDIQGTIKVFARPPNEQQLRNDYYNKVNGNSLLKQVLKTQYTVENKQFINANNPTDFDLCEYYIKKNAAVKEELIGCIESTVNFTISSQKVRTDFLLEAGSLAAAPKSLFDTKPCPTVDAVNTQQAQADAQVAAANKPAAAPGWGNFQNFFPGGR